MVNTIAIFTGSTSRSLDEFFEILEKVSSKDKCVFARLNYKDLLDEDVHPLDYPFVIYTTDNYAFCIGDVSAGYSGTGPMGTKEILLKLGFDIDVDLSSVTSHDFIKPDTDLCDKKNYPYESPVCTRLKKNPCYRCNNKRKSSSLI